MTLTDKKKYILLFILIILADQISKILIKSSFAATPYKVVTVISDILYIRFVKNPGAVWGILSEPGSPLVPRLITALSVVALIIVFFFFMKMQAKCTLELTSLSFIIGGAIGNIFDRLLQGYVVDFIDMVIVNYHWPTFNVADAFISTGVVLLIISIWRGKCTQF